MLLRRLVSALGGLGGHRHERAHVPYARIVVRRPQVDLNELCDGARAAFGEERGGGGVGTDLGVPVLDEQRSKRVR